MIYILIQTFMYRDIKFQVSDKFKINRLKLFLYFVLVLTNIPKHESLPLNSNNAIFYGISKHFETSKFQLSKFQNTIYLQICFNNLKNGSKNTFVSIKILRKNKNFFNIFLFLLSSPQKSLANGT